MGTRTKNAGKRKWERENGIAASNGRAMHMRGGIDPIFDAKADDAREESDRLAAEAKSKALAEQKRQRRTARDAGQLPRAEDVKLVPPRVSAYTPPKVRKPAGAP